MIEAKPTPGPWRTQAISDCIRVIVGTAHRTIILARCAPKQLSENETHANARLMAAAPDLLAALSDIICHRCGERIGFNIPGKCRECDPARAAIAKAVHAKAGATS